MPAILWDGSSAVLTKDGSLVMEPGECCCCETGVCSFPTPVGEDTCNNIAGIRCSGNPCSADHSTCLDELESSIVQQGYHIYYNDTCCHCDGYRISELRACCSGELDFSNVEYVPFNPECSDCDTITYENIYIDNDGENLYWVIPRCGQIIYYCVQD